MRLLRGLEGFIRSYGITEEEHLHCNACGLESAEGQFCNHCGQPLGAAMSGSTMSLPPKTDGKAIGSLVCGILGLTIFSCLAGIPAIILGHMSRSEIRKSMGRLKGEGLALAGLIMGYVSFAAIPILLITATIAIPSLLRSRQAANESAAVANLRTINTAAVTYQISGGTYGTINDLIAKGLIDETFTGTKAGYYYTVASNGTGYTAEANPVSVNTGRYGYFTTSDGEIRYSTLDAQAPPGMAGQPIR